MSAKGRKNDFHLWKSPAGSRRGNPSPLWGRYGPWSPLQNLRSLTVCFDTANWGADRGPVRGKHTSEAIPIGTKPGLNPEAPASQPGGTSFYQATSLVKASHLCATCIDHTRPRVKCSQMFCKIQTKANMWVDLHWQLYQPQLCRSWKSSFFF